jgi:hypothetical protein
MDPHTPSHCKLLDSNTAICFAAEAPWTPTPSIGALPTCPLLAPLNNNEQKMTNTTKTKMKKLPHLPHPLSLNVLVLATNKWSATTHPIKGYVIGYLGYTISYQHFYFHNNQVLQTKAFTASTTTTTIGHSGKPRGSTELDAIIRHNCAITKEDYTFFAVVVLGVHPGKMHGDQPSNGSFVNMLLCNFMILTNLNAVFALDKPDNQRGLAQILAC